MKILNQKFRLNELKNTKTDFKKLNNKMINFINVPLNSKNKMII